MRITFVLPTVNMSGGVRVVAIYAKELAARGHDVTLVSPPPQRMPLLRKIKSALLAKGWPADFSRNPSHLDGLGLNHHILDRWRPVKNIDVPDADVVVATWWETAEWVNVLDASKGAKAYFIQHHEVHPYLPVERCRATYRFPMHKIVIARWLSEVMGNEYDDLFVDLVPNSVDHDVFFAPVRHKQKIPTIGFLYSPSSYKGVDITLSAIERVRANFKKLRVISFGAQKPSWGNNIADKIEFHYSPPQERIRELYSQCDLWMTASRSEGFNLPAMEAMACRTPVVSTKAGWPEESIVDDWNGALVDVDDVESLAQAAKKILLLSDYAWLDLSNNAFSTVENSSWKRSSILFEKALFNACERKI